MVKVRVADLPTTSNVDAGSFVIIEKPNVGEGTYKSTVGDLQEAITVHAKVERDGQVTTISIDDINGHTEDSIVTPSAEIVDNGDGTVTIVITDSEGTTRETLLKNVAVIDPEPTEGSNNLVTSGTIYNLQKAITDRLDVLEDQMINANDRLAFIESVVKVIYYTDLLTESGDQVTLETGEVLEVPKLGCITEMNADGGCPAEPFMVDGVVYETLQDAIAAAVAASQGISGTVNPLVGNVIKLLGSTSNTGVSVPENSNIVIDLNGYTLTVISPAVDSSGFKLLKGASVTIKNGSINFNDPDLRIGIKNYSNLTLDNVFMRSSSTIRYLNYNGCGDIVFRNNTILQPFGTNIAFNVAYGTEAQYDNPGVNVVIEDDSVQTRGQVEFGKADRALPFNFKRYASITCPETIDLDVSILTEPCTWTDNGDGTKTLRYSD